MNRDHDIWEVMYGIAKAVGGEWPRRCIEAAEYLTEAEQSMSLGERLLQDVLEIFRSVSELKDELARLSGEPGSGREVRVVDLFSGTGGWSQAFRDAGDEVVTIDLHPRYRADPRLGPGEAD